MKNIYVDITLFESSEGGRKSPIPNIKFGCPLFFEGIEELADNGYDCRLFLDEKNEPLKPGATIKNVKVAFLSREKLEPYLKVGVKFKVWESGYIGEGIISKVESQVSCPHVR